MSHKKPYRHDEDLGKILEKTFRESVHESLEHGYVSFFDAPDNRGKPLEDMKSRLKDFINKKSNKSA